VSLPATTSTAAAEIEKLEHDLRRAFAVLKPRQVKFVMAYVKTGGKRQAAEAAGYSGSAAHVQGHRLLNNDKVRVAYAIAAELDGLKNGIPLPFKRQVLWDTAQKCRTEEHWNPQGVARCIEILSKMDGDMQPDGGGQVTIQISTGLAGNGVTVDGEVVTQPAGLVESDA